MYFRHQILWTGITILPDIMKMKYVNFSQKNRDASIDVRIALKNIHWLLYNPFSSSYNSIIRRQIKIMNSLYRVLLNLLELINEKRLSFDSLFSFINLSYSNTILHIISDMYLEFFKSSYCFPFLLVKFFKNSNKPMKLTHPNPIILNNISYYSSVRGNS